jgi:hypothetical protein
MSEILRQIDLPVIVGLPARDESSRGVSFTEAGFGSNRIGDSPLRGRHEPAGLEDSGSSPEDYSSQDSWLRQDEDRIVHCQRTDGELPSEPPLTSDLPETAVARRRTDASGTMSQSGAARSSAELRRPGCMTKRYDTISLRVRLECS